MCPGSPCRWRDWAPPQNQSPGPRGQEAVTRASLSDWSSVNHSCLDPWSMLIFINLVWNERNRGKVCFHLKYQNTKTIQYFHVCTSVCKLTAAAKNCLVFKLHVIIIWYKSDNKFCQIWIWVTRHYLFFNKSKK